MWTFAISIEKIQKEYFEQRFSNRLVRGGQDACNLMIDEAEKMLEREEITPRDFLEIIKGVNEDQKKGLI